MTTPVSPKHPTVSTATLARLNDMKQHPHKGLFVLALASIIAVLICIAMSCCFLAFASGPAKTPKPVATAAKTWTSTKPTEFMVLGDWGSGLSGQLNIANAMKALHQKAPIQFIITVGDNIYPDGDIRKFAKDYFEKPYATFVAQKIPFYPTLGNHDVPHQDEQIAYFKMPGAYYSFNKGNIAFFAINTNHFNPTQQSWLTHKLSQSKATWKIVYGHHPVYSSGPHGDEEESVQLQKELKPLLEKYHVDFYLCGHDHHYERFMPVQGVYYVLTGGGGASIRSLDNETGIEQAKSMVRHHYMWFKADGNKLYARAYGENNALIDSFYLNKK
jgi:predicted phosphodiesterase